MSEAIIAELFEFLSHERIDVKKGTYQILAQQSGNPDFISTLIQKPDVIGVLVNTLSDAVKPDNENAVLLPCLLTTLTNISTSAMGANSLLHHQKIVTSLVTIIKNPKDKFSDCASGLFANMTRSRVCCRKVLEILENDDKRTLPQLLIVATTTGYNTAGSSLDLLMNFVENLSQLMEGRSVILDREKALIHRILPFTVYEKSETRRRAAVACLYNCSFNKGDHMWLLSSDVDIASYLCLPLLAGGDTFRDDEVEDLSDLLVYPDDEKMRESSEEIRLMLVQALTQLCATKSSREVLRTQSIYSILREYHKWEKSPQIVPLLEDLINILIKTEEEMGTDDLTEVEVPAEKAEKFKKEDEEYAKELINTEK